MSRMYMVPFKKDAEPKIVYNLNARQIIWIGCSIVLSILLGIIQVVILQFPVFVPFITAIPVIGGACYMAFKTVKHVDYYTTMDKHLWLSLKYSFTSKTYLNYRRNVKLPQIEEEGML